MAKVKPKPLADLKKELTINLFGPGMTALHRVGLAGLWMTLKKFERDGVRTPGGDWEVTNRSVTLRWNGNPRTFFESLFKNSFKIDKKGLLWFAALGDPLDYVQAAVILNDAMLGTFLQHGNIRHRKADPSNKPTGAIAVEIDETTLPLKYRKVKSYPHQYAALDFTNHKDQQLRVARLAGWHFPGGAVRHSGFGDDTALEEPPERLVPLLYAPVGGIYFQIRRRGEGVRPLFALVIPEIADLEKYAEARAVFLQQGVKELLASGTADAGWRVLATLQAKGVLSSLGSPACRVVSFGTVPWSKQQKTRVDLFTVRAGAEERLRTFKLCLQVFVPRLVKPNDGVPFWDVPQTPELIARNLSEGRSWYAGFSEFVLRDSGARDQTGKRLLMWHLITAPYRGEKGGLNKMIDEASFADERERTFVRACHEALNQIWFRLQERAEREATSFTDLWDRQYERIRVRLARSKNIAAVRQEIADLWSRAVPNKALQAEWPTLLPFVSSEDWRKARDLALLALASYQWPKKKTSIEKEGVQ